jgi:class 3 adenylate cyclase
MFCDVRRFTAFSEAVEPEEVMEVLQSIHQEMGDLVEKHGGTIGYRAGDGLMVVFNDPLPVDRPVEKAVALGREIRAAFAGVREKWRDLGHELGIGIGLAYGYATLGVIGSENRLDYTAIGNVVNIAARLCDIAEDGDILLERRAQVELGERVATEPVSSVQLKGLRRETEVFRLVNDVSSE